MPAYPWYAVASGDDIEQGDIFEDCPIFLPPADLNLQPDPTHGAQAQFRWEQQDVIVLSQTCDLVKDREKLSDVLLCTLWKRSEHTGGPLSKDEGMESARLGRMPGFHILGESLVEGFAREVRIVDFRRVHSLPLAFVRKRAESSPRLRLLPPYREHLSQAFARFFMRVGLPVDIPSFTPPKQKSR